MNEVLIGLLVGGFVASLCASLFGGKKVQPTINKKADMYIDEEGRYRMEGRWLIDELTRSRVEVREYEHEAFEELCKKKQFIDVGGYETELLSICKYGDHKVTMKLLNHCPETIQYEGRTWNMVNKECYCDIPMTTYERVKNQEELQELEDRENAKKLRDQKEVEYQTRKQQII